MRSTKLFAADLDGTLVHSDNTLPKDLGEVIELLKKRNIFFVAASGRQYSNIYKTLFPYSKDIYIIAENGSVNGYGDKITDCFYMKEDKVIQVYENLSKINKEFYPVACTPKCAYYLVKEENIIQSIGVSFTECKNFYKEEYEGKNKIEILKNKLIEENVQKEVCKIANYCNGKSYEVFPLIPKIDGHKIVISNNNWIDISENNVNKGRALNLLIKKLNIPPKDCISFGDQFNDEDMLSLCGQGYIMANGADELKKKFKVAESNDNDGVTKKIKELLKI